MDYITDQLHALNGLSVRRMFGGHGLYRHAIFFGILHKDRLYFKTDDKNRNAYAARGMEPFRPSAKQTLKNYYEVPADVLEDADMLCEWARQSLTSQGAERSSRPSSRRRRVAKSSHIQ